ncbi:MAG: transcription elongation factor GreA [Bacteroidota bacterium]
MNLKINYYTKEGLDKIRQELRFLEEIEMPLIAKQIGEASEKGDRRENAEYHAAKDKQRITSMRIHTLKNAIANAVILNLSMVDTSQVNILTKVTIQDLDTNKQFIYTLVSEKEVDMKSGKISVNSPIGKGLLGKKINEIAVIAMPTPSIRQGLGINKRSFKILDIAI